MEISQLLNYLLGSTTLASIYIAWKSRKSEIKKAEANALETIQLVYDKFAKDTDERIDRLTREISSLRKENEELKNNQKEILKELSDYKKKCDRCKNYPTQTN
jgi:predicted RNase H-like nuclease (RuvC/YqgF family)